MMMRKMYRLLLETMKEYDSTIYRQSVDVINEHFKNYNGLLVGAEIGVCYGKHASMLLKKFRNRLVLYLVDPYHNYKDIDSITNQREIEQKAQDRLKHYVGNAVFYKLSSKRASRCFNDDMLDFVYIDGNHKKLFVKQDITCWYPKVRRGGLIMGHDFQDTGVARAVLEQFPHSMVRTCGYPVTWWVKKI